MKQNVFDSGSHIDGVMQDCNNYSALAMELLALSYRYTAYSVLYLQSSWHASELILTSNFLIHNQFIMSWVLPVSGSWREASLRMASWQGPSAVGWFEPVVGQELYLPCWNESNSIDEGRQYIVMQFNINYRQVSNISCTKSQRLKYFPSALRLSLPNPLKPDVKSRMKM